MKALRIITGILQILHSLIFIMLGVLLFIMQDIFVAIAKALVDSATSGIGETTEEQANFMTDFITNNTMIVIVGLAVIGVLLFINAILLFVRGGKFRLFSELASVVIFILVLGLLIVNQMKGYTNTSITVFVDLGVMLALNVILLLYYIIKKDDKHKKGKDNKDVKTEENKTEEIDTNKENQETIDNNKKQEDIQGSYVEELLDKDYHDNDIQV